MRFENRESLRQWYEHDEHSAIRRKIFETLDPLFEGLFAEIDRIVRDSPTEVQVSQLYENIETHAKDFMGRRDYCDTETLLDIVRTKPFRPKIRF